MHLGLDHLSGQQLGQYKLVELLGAGGMGAVYRGYQPSLQRGVAVKVIFTPQLQYAQGEKRFLREARTAAALEHQHIVPVYDFGSDLGVSYVVMRMLDGPSLAERINYTRQPFLPLREVAGITSDLASALQYAHQRQVIHRDIKANNVMFDDQGTVFLVDFGIAKMVGDTSSLTGTGFKIGTPNFMAPEQWRSQPLTPALDQYALAILMYQMLCGEFPFQGDEPYQLMHSHLNRPPIPLSLYRDDLAADLLMPVLAQALSKNPEDRFSDIQTFANTFADVVDNIPVNHTPNLRRMSGENPLPTPVVSTPILAQLTQSTPQRADRSWKRYSIVLIAVLLLAAGMGALLLSSKGSATPPVALADNEASSTSMALLALPTETATASKTSVPAATASETAVPSATATASATGTASPPTTELPSATATASATAQTVALVAEPASFSLPLMAMETSERAVIALDVTCPPDRCYTLDITIHFDPAVIQVDRIDPTRSQFEPVLTADNRIDNDAGIVRLIANAQNPETLMVVSDQGQASATPEGEGRVLELYVSAINPGTSPLQVDSLYVFDDEGQSLRTISTDGGVFVSGETSVVSQETCTYRVRSGDTLSAIAAANRVSIAQISELNEIPNQSIIRVGQDLEISAATCHAPSQVQTSSDGSSQTFAVFDCRNLGNNVFEWYSAEVDHNQAGNATNVTYTGGPYSGAWQPGCPAPNGSSSSSSSSNSSTTNSASGGSGSSGSSGDTNNSGGGEGGDDGGGLGGIVCGLLPC